MNSHSSVPSLEIQNPSLVLYPWPWMLPKLSQVARDDIKIIFSRTSIKLTHESLLPGGRLVISVKWTSNTTTSRADSRGGCWNCSSHSCSQRGSLRLAFCERIENSYTKGYMSPFLSRVLQRGHEMINVAVKKKKKFCCTNLSVLWFWDNCITHKCFTHTIIPLSLKQLFNWNHQRILKKKSQYFALKCRCNVVCKYKVPQIFS